MLETEKRNPASMHLHTMSNVEIADLMNKTNDTIESAIAANYTTIDAAITACTNSLQTGGRIIYMGAGTSGRLGVLDAAECVPTFNVDPTLVVGLIAGGHEAMFSAAEGAEDNSSLGETDLQHLGLQPTDTVIGLAASGRTPYVIGGLNYANSVGATSIAIATNTHSKIGAIAKIAIELATGPEILTGSTRLASGTAQKEVLNMISTITMIRMGKVYSNLMIDVKPSNIKLQRRARNIIHDITNAEPAAIEQALQAANNEVGVAIVMLRKHLPVEESKQLLQNHTVAELI
ncbi:N-acetylmuramic acid 6-phosphate etherase [Lacticaseibacillus pantheris]|uniref:N-acetylmuramic acid 6-phosphate etherase n=1 Tax=Lacticaseibacillus pantheris TaxID=171523 RepID=UPI00265B23B9|nr:N-acetylmuramic acid 6-phosphate etherase [Lacticaseibacillus pantheris]WKF84166.1 N-acetylmuramic acid 6-phosphate etherase [Lacticaseibacillus pantheris]